MRTDPSPVPTFRFAYYMRTGSRTFPLVVVPQQRSGGLGIQMHRHDFLELVYVIAGHGITHIEGADYRIRRGDLYVLNIGSAHSYRACRGLKYYDVLIPPDFFAPSEVEALRALDGFCELFWLESMFRAEDKFRYRLRLAPALAVEVEELLGTLRDELDGRANGYEVLARACLTTLLAKLCRFYSRQIVTTGAQVVMSGRKQALMKVLAHVEAHFADPIYIKDMASLAYLSSRQFTTVFRRTVGMTPMEYVNDLRIEKARELLAGTDMTVTEVAFAVGFHDSGYFTRMFRRLAGQTPRAYRGTQHAESNGAT